MNIDTKKAKQSPANTKPFKPLTGGLGLDHFADGLPYTPANAKKKPIAHFHYTNQPKVSVPIVAKTEIKVEAETETRSFAWLKTKRLLAFILDWTVINGLYAMILFMAFQWAELDLIASFTQNRTIFISAATLFYSLFFMAYFLIQEVLFLTTLGKSIFSIKTQASWWGAIVVKEFCFLLALFPFGIGLFWSFFDQKKRCWHDVISNTQVIGV